MKYASRINSFKRNEKDILKILDKISKIEGITHVDLNYPEHFENNTWEVIKAKLDEVGLKLNGLALRFRDEFINGELANINDEISNKAKQLCFEAVDICKKMNGEIVTIWLGYDGFDYCFQQDYTTAWEKIRSSFVEICEVDKSIKVSIEYKPFEERGFSLIPSSTATLLMVSEVNKANIGITLDYCHMLMKKENPSYGLALVAERDKLYGIHMNDGFGLKDDGMMVGSATLVQTLEFIYYLKKYGYDGVIYFDTFPIRENDVEECQYNVKMFNKLCNCIDNYGVEKINQLVLKNSGFSTMEILLDVLK
jgi:xylose isomerase